MEILPYKPDMAPAVAAALNEALAAVPHCYSIGADEFAEAMAVLSDVDRTPKEIEETFALVVRQDADIVGFAQLAVERPQEEGKPPQGVIQFLCYNRGQRQAGQALLERAEAAFRERGLDQVTAFPSRYRFPHYHVKYANLSVHLDHVQALLAWNGYTRVNGEVFLDWLDYDLGTLFSRPAATTAAGTEAARFSRPAATTAAPPLPVEIKLEWQPGRGERPGLTVLAFQEGKEIGTCVHVSGSEYSSAEAAADWTSCTWLGVDEAVQGQRLGHYLLGRALVELKGIGYRHAVISTAWDNHRAYLFYTNFGYRMVDWTYGYRRTL